MQERRNQLQDETRGEFAENREVKIVIQGVKSYGLFDVLSILIWSWIQTGMTGEADQGDHVRGEYGLVVAEWTLQQGGSWT